MEEIWIDIKDYEGLYQVSNFGRVKSMERYKSNPLHDVVKIKERILKPSITIDGYNSVTLFKNGVRKHFRIHRLVAEAFILNPDNLPQVNHKDENPSNNNVINLEWCDAKYNINYGTAIRRRSRTLSKKLLNREDLSRPILQYTIDGQLVAEYPSVMEAARQNGLSRGNLSNCCNGGYFDKRRNKWVNVKQSYGYIWKLKF